MGLKKLLMIVLILAIAFGVLTQGKIWSLLLPNYETIIGTGLCVAGGYMAYPIYTVGELIIPIPVADNLVFAGYILSTAGLSTYLIRKQKQLSLKKKVAYWLTILVILMLIYGYIGVYFAYVAETQFGQTNCVTTLDLGVAVVQYEWFNQFYMVGVIGMVITLLGTMWYMAVKHGEGATKR